MFKHSEHKPVTFAYQRLPFGRLAPSSPVEPLGEGPDAEGNVLEICRSSVRLGDRRTHSGRQEEAALFFGVRSS